MTYSAEKHDDLTPMVLGDLEGAGTLCPSQSSLPAPIKSPKSTVKHSIFLFSESS